MIEINPNKTSQLKTLAEIDITPLRERVAQLSLDDWDTQEDFEVNYNKNDKGALRSTQHIIFKFANKQDEPFTYFEGSRWKDWKQMLMPMMEQATTSYAYDHGYYPKVMLAKMPPQTFIPPHTDGNKKGFVPHKIHIPITTNDKVFFFEGSERHHLQPGTAYEVNNGIRHSVVNGGDTDRIHLIFEYLNLDLQPEALKQKMLNPVVL
jgi:aspartyl/asparaginyl beta-hydroxylase (cupin superfamily)